MMRGRQDYHVWTLHREMLSAACSPGTVVPLRVVGNWESEMHKLFSCFPCGGRGEAKTGNPFTGSGSDLCIVSWIPWLESACFPACRSPTSSLTTW